MCEKNLTLRESDEHGNNGEGENILLRNRCLQLLHTMLWTPRGALSMAVCDEISRILGFDWLLLFMQPNLHPSTVVWAMRIIIVLGSIPALLSRFREGSANGGWLRHTELVSQNKMAVMLGCPMNQSVGAPTPQTNCDVKPEALHVPGFQQMGWFLPHHLDVPEMYFLLTALIMGQPVKLLPGDTKFDLGK